MLALILRADAGGTQGSGHAMRLAALGEAWAAQGGKVLFASAALPEELAGRIGALPNVKLHRLTGPAWSADEARALAALAAEQGARAIVVDSYLYDETYLDALRAAGLQVAVIDDVGRLGRYACALIVNPNLHGEAALYDGKADTAALLMGPSFAMLRAEFFAAASRERTIAPLARSVLATFGGVDPKGASLKCLDAFGRLDAAIAPELIVGAANPNADEIAARAPAHVRVTRDARDIAQRFAAADIVLSAGGTTVWEAACVGAPLMLVAVAPEEAVSAARLQRAGACLYVGEIDDIDAEALAETIDAFSHDLAARARSHVLGKALVDGRGAARVAAALAGLGGI